MPQTKDLSQAALVQGSLHEEMPSFSLNELTARSDAVRRAVLDTGFFCLDDVFANRIDVDNVLRQMQIFFSLADSDPLKKDVSARIADRERGWTPLFEEPAYQPGTVARVESFDCGRKTPAGMQSLNVWPALPAFRNDVRRCWDTMTAAGEAVLMALARAANLDANFFADRCASQELNTMRLLHYPGSDQPLPDDQVGISAHTDFECVTLLMQTAPGLELCDRGGNWYDAPLHDGRIVVLLDDMLERWTNGYFSATGHRVRNTPHERFSIVMFFAVNDDEVVAPLDEFVTEDNPAKYSPVSQRAHLYREVDKAVENRNKMGSEYIS